MQERLRKRIENSARARDVSLNAEMVTRLEESFRREKRVAELREMWKKGE
jgi:hypothetical protein